MRYTESMTSCMLPHVILGDHWKHLLSLRLGRAGRNGGPGGVRVQLRGPVSSRNSRFNHCKHKQMESQTTLHHGNSANTFLISETITKTTTANDNIATAIRIVLLLFNTTTATSTVSISYNHNTDTATLLL